MTVKDILSLLADCPPESNVSVAVTEGLQTNIMPATQAQLLVNKADGRKFFNLVISHNKNMSAAAQ